MKELDLDLDNNKKSETAKTDEAAEEIQTAKKKSTYKIERATFGARVVATLIDSSILTTLMISIDIALLFIFGKTKQPLLVATSHYLLSFSISFCYSGFMVSKLGTTVGKIIMGLKVMDLKTRQYPTFLKAGLREWAKIISAIPLMIGFLLVLFRTDKRALHDLLCTTTVLKVTPQDNP